MSKKRKILIVDDEKGVCDLLKEFFESQYQVEVAYDGKECLEKVSAFQPDCILLDLKMPGMGGKEVLKIIHSVKPGIIIIFVTGTHDYFIAEDLIEMGAYGYVTKPIDLDYLTQTMDLAFKHQEGLAKKKRNR